MRSCSLCSIRAGPVGTSQSRASTLRHGTPLQELLLPERGFWALHGAVASQGPLEQVAGHATRSHLQLLPFPGCPWPLRIGAHGSADLWPCEDFAVGSGTLALLVPGLPAEKRVSMFNRR
ncbi:uncharacterized protein ACIBXB_006636 isoform 1-T3 [Morphnus guianensis]